MLWMVACLSAAQANAAETRACDEIVARMLGQTVFWNAWAGDERTNPFINWTKRSKCEGPLSTSSVDLGVGDGGPEWASRGRP
jgi:ABC-type uncharacterized transport system YnjBCD substrate-binding protein